jgi:hypothetical protein
MSSCIAVAAVQPALYFNSFGPLVTMPLAVLCCAVL